MRLSRRLWLGIAAALAVAIPAHAEVSQHGSLRVSFEGAISPQVLPRHTRAPVAVRVGGDIRARKGARLPQLRRISVAINRAGRIESAGIPPCQVGAIQPATPTSAREVCARSIVGAGHVTVEVHIEHQRPFSVRSSLLAFKGPVRQGQSTILAQVYSKNPPGAFVLTFRTRRRAGLFGTVLTANLPRSARKWAYLTHFDMTLHRVYGYRGRTRSYVSAACGAPAGFPGAVFPLAKASYGFANGQTLRTTVVRSCKVGGG